ncbi:MAG: polyprenyl synthetase family protein [Deltaproteobacteria bacterium]|nr:MAG: polyprenyl synthetase family protein [Deltaproteobacteria bacterium]
MQPLKATLGIGAEENEVTPEAPNVGLPPWLRQVRTGVDERLVEFFEEKRRETREISSPTLELVDEIEALTMRGGKRLRPALAAAAYRCICPGQGMERLAELCGSLELLQSYLLIHDDWMDGDDVRRGGAAVHASLQRNHGDRHLGAALAILAGDLASAYAWELFMRAPYPVQSWSRAASLFLRTQKEVYCGQHLDLIGDADVSRMHGLKTTSYTVRGPLLLGALLSEPRHRQLEALTGWATPIGEAFQVRDDLLGALGSPDATGKPGLDLPHGKLSSVLDELRKATTHAEREPVEQIIGRGQVSDQELNRARDLLHDLGIVDRLERRIKTLRKQADAVLVNAPFSPQGRNMLTRLADKLTIRQS